MAINALQINLDSSILFKVDSLVKSGIYPNRSRLIADALRSFILDRFMGIIPNNGDSVEEIRIIREKLSKENFNLEEINKFNY